MLGIYAPYDFNEINGNTLRPIRHAEGLRKNNLKDFIIYCTKRNSELDFKQEEVSKDCFTLIPGKLRPKGVPFIFDMPLISGLDLSGDINLIYLHNYYSILALPTDYEGKIILDFHELKSVSLIDLHYGKYHPRNFIFRTIIIPIITRIEKKAIKKSDKIVVASGNIKKKLINRYNVQDDKVIVINNSIDPDEYLINNHQREFKVGIVGPFMQKNNEEIHFIRSIAQKSDVDFVVVGSITRKDKQLLSGMSNVEVRGWLTDEDYKEFLGTISVLLLPYITYHGGGGAMNKLLEAAASGTPIVSTKAGARGFKEKDTLVMVENEKEIIENIKILKSNNDLRIKMGKQLRQIIKENYNYRHETKKTIDLYGELTS